MIKIEDKHNCCGCSACVQSCPKQCISFDEDDQGFRYPSVDTSRCVDCGLCEKVCPCLNQIESREPIIVYAAIHPNEEVRMKSSSGGIFSMLADKIIEEGGVVFGARFDENWEVMHDYTESKEGLDAFRGSKYLQSRIGKSYKQARIFLNEGRKVLFSGTGCQIAGLKKFLQQEYDNLLTVSILCCSVSSPLVWRKYLKEKCGDNSINSVDFRDKTSGWSHYSYSIVINHENDKYVEPASGDYMKGLTSNLITRPSCSHCPTRFGKSKADIVLGDCWGIWDVQPEMDDNKGMSIVEIYSTKGLEITSSLGINQIKVDLSQLEKYNSGLKHTNSENRNHDRFFVDIVSGSSVSESLNKYLGNKKPSTIQKLRQTLASIIKKR